MCLLEPFTGSKSTSPKNTCFQENMFSEHRKTPQKHPKNTKKHGFWKNMFLSLTLVPPHPPPPPPPKHKYTNMLCNLWHTVCSYVQAAKYTAYIYQYIYAIWNKIPKQEQNQSSKSDEKRKLKIFFIFLRIYYFFVLVSVWLFLQPFVCSFRSLFRSFASSKI